MVQKEIVGLPADGEAEGELKVAVELEAGTVWFVTLCVTLEYVTVTVLLTPSFDAVVFVDRDTETVMLSVTATMDMACDVTVVFVSDTVV